MKKIYLILGLISLVSMGAYVSDVIELDYPGYFPKPHYNFERNTLTKEAISLGRILFYDPILSKDSTVSCASCHSPYNAFAHTDHDLSHGINDRIGRRNAPALFNLAWHKSFMWDGAINHLDMQALAPINHPDEMGESTENVIRKLQRKKIYPLLFYAAFGDSTVTGEYILKSLAQFQLTLVSKNSKYDKVKMGKSTFNEQEKKGYDLFQKNCNTCHAEPLFSNYGFAKNGLPIDTTLNDLGKWEITKNNADSLLFKIPSLRNLSYTYPYMHDGRFRRLRDVLKHYNAVAGQASNISSKFNDIQVLSRNEQTELITFLLTLNDSAFVFNKNNTFPIELLNSN